MWVGRDTAWRAGKLQSTVLPSRTEHSGSSPTAAASSGSDSGLWFAVADPTCPIKAEKWSKKAPKCQGAGVVNLDGLRLMRFHSYSAGERTHEASTAGAIGAINTCLVRDHFGCVDEVHVSKMIQLPGCGQIPGATPVLQGRMHAYTNSEQASKASSITIYGHLTLDSTPSHTNSIQKGWRERAVYRRPISVEQDVHRSSS